MDGSVKEELKQQKSRPEPVLNTEQAQHNRIAIERSRAEIKAHAQEVMSRERQSREHGDALSWEARCFIVESLASYVRPKQVIGEVKEIFGLDISKQRLQHYDPNTVAGNQLGAELKELFFQTRANYRNSADEIGITHQSYRLEQLQDIHDIAKARGDSRMVLKILKHAALEVGGRYNRLDTRTAREAAEFFARVLRVPVSDLPPSQPKALPSCE